MILWLAPQLGNYIRPALVMVNLLLVNPMNNIVAVAIWAGAGLLGGIIAGTKKGAFVVGLFTWLSAVVILVFCVFQLISTGVELGTLPPMPQGTGLADILTIPLIQSLIGDLFGLIGMIGNGGGGMPDIGQLIAPLVIYVLVPVIVVIVAAIIGATIRPKE